MFHLPARSVALFSKSVPDDQQTVAETLASLVAIENEDGFTRQFERYMVNLSRGVGPYVKISALPVVSIEDLVRDKSTPAYQQFRDEKRLAKAEQRGGAGFEWKLEGLELFGNCDPLNVFGIDAGSENVLANRIRDLSRKIPNFILPDAKMVQNVGRPDPLHLVLLADYSGTGTQLIRFIKLLRNNARIAELVGAGELKVSVYVHVVTEAAIREIRKSPILSGIHIEFCYLAPSIKSPWIGSSYREELEKFCLENSSVDEFPALGYGDSAGLYASAFSVPNNLPAVFLSSNSAGASYTFENRSIRYADRLVSKFSPLSVPIVRKHLSCRDAGAFGDRIFGKEQFHLSLDMLATVDTPRSFDYLWGLIGMPRKKTAEILSLLTDWQLISRDGDTYWITQSGKAMMRGIEAYERAKAAENRAVAQGLGSWLSS